MPRIERLWIKPAAGAAMEPTEQLTIRAEGGIEGNKPQQRPITFIAQERWNELMSDMGSDLDPATRRANVLVSGIDLIESTGKTIRIGNVELIVRGETRPCGQMEAALPGLKAKMDERWGGGAWAEVVTGGTIRAGDEVVLG